MPTLEDLYPELYGTPEDTLQQNRPGFFSGVWHGLGGLATGTGRAIEDSPSFTPEAQLGIGTGLREFGEGVQARNPVVGSFEEFVQNPWVGAKSLVGQAVGSTLPALIPYVGPVSRALGAKGAFAAGTGIMGLQSYGGIRATQEQTGERDILAAVAGAAATGAIEQLGGIQRLFRPAGSVVARGVTQTELGEMATTPLRTFGLQTARIAGAEAGEEILQSPIEQYAGGLDPTSPEQLGHTAFAGFAGAIGGAPFGVASGARRGLQHADLNTFTTQTLGDPLADTQSQLQAFEVDNFFRPDEALQRQRIAQLINARIQDGSQPFNLMDVPKLPDVLEAPWHAGLGAMPPGTSIETQVSRAAGILQAAGQTPGWEADSQFVRDVEMASALLQRTLPAPQYEAFIQEVGLGAKPQAAPKVTTPKPAPAPKGVSPTAKIDATPPFVKLYKEAGGIYSPVQKALAEVQTPEQATEIVQNWLENKRPSQKVIGALEEMHKRLTGRTFTQVLQEREQLQAPQVAPSTVGARVDPKAPGPVKTTKFAPTVDYKLSEIGPHEPDRAGMSYAAQMRAGKKKVTYLEPGDPQAEHELDALVTEGLAVKRPYKMHGEYPTSIYAMKGAEKDADALVKAFDRLSREGETDEVADAVGAALGYTPEQRKSYINRLRRLEAGEWVQDWEHTPESPMWVRQLPDGEYERSTQANPYKGDSDVDRQAPLPQQQAPAAQGAGPVQAPQAQARAESPSAQREAEPVTEENALQMILGELAARDPVKAVILDRHLQGQKDGDIAKAISTEKRPYSKQRIQQLRMEAQAMAEGIARGKGLRPEQFREKEVEDDPQPGDAPRATPQSSFNRPIADVSALGLPTTGENDATGADTGYKTRPMAEVNSSNIAGEVVVKTNKEGDPTGELGQFIPDSEGEANTRLRAFETAQKTGETDVEAAVVWDTAAHVYTAQGEKMKAWSDVTPETKKEWAEFYAQVKANTQKSDKQKDAGIARKLRDFLKRGSYTERSDDEVMSGMRGFRAVAIGDNPYLMRAMAKRFSDGYGPILKERFYGTFAADHDFPGDAMVGKFDDARYDGKYIMVVRDDIWNRRPNSHDHQFYLERMFHHEIEHILDDTGKGEKVPGDFSNDSRLSAGMRAFTSAGSVFKEIWRAVDGNRDPWVAGLFAYPVRDHFHLQLGEVGMMKELYAQVMSAYHVRPIRLALEERLPLTMAFAREYEQKVREKLVEGRVQGVTGTVAPGVDGQRTNPDFQASQGQEPRVLFAPQGHEGFAQALGRLEADLQSRDQLRIRRARDQFLNLGRTPVVLRAVMDHSGAKPFRRSDVLTGTGATVYLKGADVHRGALHGGAVPMDVLKRLPELLADPVAVFQSSKHSDDPNSFKILIDAEVGGAPVVVAMKPNHPIKEARGEPAHFTVTIFPLKRGWPMAGEWAEAGLLRYYDDQRLSAAGDGTSPQGGRSRLNPSVARNKNVVTKTQLQGTPEAQWSMGLDDMIRSENFRKWFGDSKMVDENGRPKVFYHGTKSGDFETFKSDHDQKMASDEGHWGNRGIYFTEDPGYAESYTRTFAQIAQGDYSHRAGAAIYPVFLRVEKPYVIRKQSTWDKFLGGRFSGSPGTESMSVTQEMLDSLRADGYDGIVNERYREVVVFSPTQIKSATGNRGTFDPENPNISFSMGLDEIIASIPQERKRAATTISDAWAKYKPTLLTLHQLVDQFGSKLASLKDYVASMDKMEQRQNVLMSRAHNTLTKWQQLHGQTRHALNAVMLEATTRGIHPDEPFGSGTPNEHITDQDEYLAIKRKYDALAPEARQLYGEVKKLLADNWQARKESYARAVATAYGKLIGEATDDARKKELETERDKAIAEHDKRINSLKGPYFPLLRFGDYLAIGESKELRAAREAMENASGKEHADLRKQVERLKKDSKHYVVQAFESRYKADQASKLHAARGLQSRVQLAEEHLRALQPVSAGAVDRIGQRLAGQFDRETANKLKQLITELYISSLPEHAALQRQLRRQGIEGATSDMLRATAQVVEKDAFYLSRMEYADEITDNLFKLKQESKAGGVEFQHVYNNIARRAALDFEHKATPVQNFLARMSGIWHLGMSPAYLLTNSSQPWMITAPVLAGKFGLTKSLQALRGAYVDAVNIIRQSKAGGAFADIRFDGVADAGERAALKNIMDRGQIDITQNVDMGLIAEGIDPRFLKAQKVFNWTNHHIEATNRIVTGIAAYRLARGQGMSQEDAQDYAFKQVVDTQLNYTDANAAYWMKRGAVPLGKLIFQFRKYQQGMLYLLARNSQLAWKGDKDAQRALGYLMGMQMLMAGAVGIPVVTGALAAFGMFTADDDEEGDLETQMRNYLADAMGPEAARAFWKGLPTLLGLDVSRRIGMGDIWNPLPFLRLTGKTGTEDAGQLVASVLGAPMGMLGRMWDGAKLIENGDWQKGIEKFMPKMVSDLVRAERYADEGISTRSGTVTLKPDRLDGWDIIFRAAGFSPTVESEYYAAMGAKEDTARAISERRKVLLAEYANTVIAGRDARGALEEISEWNRRHPGKGVRIDRSSMLQAVQTRRRGQKELSETGVRFQRSQRSLQGIDRFAQDA